LDNDPHTSVLLTKQTKENHFVLGSTKLYTSSLKHISMPTRLLALARERRYQYFCFSKPKTFRIIYDARISANSITSLGKEDIYVAFSAYLDCLYPLEHHPIPTLLFVFLKQILTSHSNLQSQECHPTTNDPYTVSLGTPSHPNWAHIDIKLYIWILKIYMQINQKNNIKP